LNPGVVRGGSFHHFGQRFATRSVDQLVLDIVSEAMIELIDQCGFVVLDILAEALEIRNILGDRRGLSEGSEFPFRRDDQVGVAVNGREGVYEGLESAELRGGLAS
jgi:hypothetical protein